MIERLRLSELAVFASWVVFVVAGLAFQRMTEGAPFTGIAADQPTVLWTYLAVVAGAVLSLCSVIFASLPIALANAPRAIAQRNRRHDGLLAACFSWRPSRAPSRSARRRSKPTSTARSTGEPPRPRS